MIVAVQTVPSIAADLLKKPPTLTGSLQIVALARRFHTTLQSTFSHVPDTTLQSHFFMEVSDLAVAEELVALLKKAKGVEAAYVKPHDEAP